MYRIKYLALQDSIPISVIRTLLYNRALQMASVQFYGHPPSAYAIPPMRIHLFVIIFVVIGHLVNGIHRYILGPPDFHYAQNCRMWERFNRWGVSHWVQVSWRKIDSFKINAALWNGIEMRETKKLTLYLDHQSSRVAEIRFPQILTKF